MRMDAQGATDVAAAPILKYLRGVKRCGSAAWVAFCPNHNDVNNRSLSVKLTEAGQTLLNCFAGCSYEQVVGSVPMTPEEWAAMNGHRPDSSSGKRIVATYDYTDEAGKVLYQVVRFEPKDFRCRRPDGLGGWTWKLGDVRHVPYRLHELPEARRVYIPEGEGDADTLVALGLTATTNHGGAGKWNAAHTQALVDAAVAEVVVLRDNDYPGADHQVSVVGSLVTAGLRVKRLELPGLPPLRDKHGEDVTDWLAAGHTCDELEALADAAPLGAEANTGHERRDAEAGRASVWDAAVSVPRLLDEVDEGVTYLEPRLLVRGVITEMYAPRGLGKTQVSYAVAVRLSKTAGIRILLVDRDNPRHEIRRRLKRWGGTEAHTFKVLGRDNAPALTDVATWRAFPLDTYDVVIVDSIDAATEGVGEGDSARPAKAFAQLLDLARRADGPAILVLGNVIKSGAHSRGCGVLEDRGDIVYEVRDATDLKPSGTRDWWMELPPPGWLRGRNGPPGGRNATSTDWHSSRPSFGSGRKWSRSCSR